MSAYTVTGGWLCVPYEGHELATIHIAIGAGRQPDEAAWQPAFLDTLPAPDGRRVAKVRVAGRPKRQHVWIRVNGHVTRVM